MADPYPLSVEDTGKRDPEWEELESGYGQEQTRMRKIKWDPIHDEITSEGPTVVVNPPERPA